VPSLKSTASIFLELFSIECCAALVDVITFLICIIQRGEYLQNEKRYAKKENAIPVNSERPFKQAAIIFYFIGKVKSIRNNIKS